jgi:micrococcal nuclease
MSEYGSRGRGDLARFWPEARRKRTSWVRFLPLWAGAALAGGAYGAGWIGAVWPTQSVAAVGAATSNPIRVNFGFCHTGGGKNCVVDGDTIWLGGQKIRVADIDAPETHPPRCSREAELGDRATRRLQQLLNGGAVSLAAIDRYQDRYGRKLMIVLVDGRSVGDRLVDEGLARHYAGGRKPWC